MSKYQEALERIFPPKYFNNIFPQFIGITTSLRIERKDFETIKELVDKETPMKPKTIKSKIHKGTEWVCPNCNHHIAYFDELGIGTVRVFNYCIECGQRLNLRSDSE